MKLLVDLNRTMLQEYGKKEGELRKLASNPIHNIDAFKDHFNEMICYSIAHHRLALATECRWLAFVYRSLELQQFIFNQSHSLLDDKDEDAKFSRMQGHIFHWYENRAKTGEILSLFQIGLSSNFRISDCPYFGFKRGKDGHDDAHLLDLDSLLPPDFVQYYYQELWRYIERTQSKTEAFCAIDHLMQCACNAILSTAWGTQEATRLRSSLSEITKNVSIIRASQKSLLAAVLALVFVDPNWSYYYYLPYAAVKNYAYAAVGLACQNPHNMGTGPLRHDMAGIFQSLEVLEDSIGEYAKSENEKHLSAIADLRNMSYRDAGFEDQYLSELSNLLQSKRGVDAGFVIQAKTHSSTISQPSEWPDSPCVWVPMKDGSSALMMKRVADKIEPEDIPGLVSFISSTVDHEKLCSVIEAPFDSEGFKLNGWLDMDVISSTRIFEAVSSTSRSDSYRLASRLRDYFEQRILGNGALKTNETPDGWMCGFATANAAIKAAVQLARDLEEGLNKPLMRDYKRIYDATNGGIGLRVGVHVGPVNLPKKGELGEVASNVLNHTGHLQKQGGEKFLEQGFPKDLDRPSNGKRKEMLSWVIALSDDAQKALNAMNGDTDALWLNDKASYKVTIDPPHDAYVYGELKKRASRFDDIDKALKVGKTICADRVRVYPYIKDEAQAVLSLVERRHTKNPFRTCLDIGSGSGIYAFFLSKLDPPPMVTAIEPETVVCKTWKENRSRLNIATNRCKLLKSRFDAVKESLEKTWDLVVFNLPYVPTSNARTAFSHSAGGRHGLDAVCSVLDWLNEADVRVGMCVFPVYSLARAENKEASLLYEEIMIKRKNLDQRYHIKWKNHMTPNWFVLRYCDEPDKEFLPLVQAFPEARRRRDVANWLYKLREEEGWKFMWHTLIEMTLKK